MRLRETTHIDLRAPTKAGAASLALMVTSLLALDGCQAIKGIFEAGFGIGVIVVIAVVATVGGVIAMLRRK